MPLSSPSSRPPTPLSPTRATRMASVPPLPPRAGAVLPLFAFSRRAEPVSAADKPKATFAKEGVAFLQKHCIALPRREGQEGRPRPAHLPRRRRPAQGPQGVAERPRRSSTPARCRPAGRPRPAPDEVEAFLAVVKGVFDRADRNAKPDPGRVTVRRLNRAEYNNTIRDLVGVDFKPAEDFPSDDVGHGFDNIGDVLSLSPVLMERYLAAAESIMQRAIVADAAQAAERCDVGALPRAGHAEGRPSWRPLDARGDVLHTPYKLTLAGEYTLPRPRLRRAHRQGAGQASPSCSTARRSRRSRSTATEKASRRSSRSRSTLPPGDHRIAVDAAQPRRAASKGRNALRRVVRRSTARRHPAADAAQAARRDARQDQGRADARDPGALRLAGLSPAGDAGRGRSAGQAGRGGPEARRQVGGGHPAGHAGRARVAEVPLPRRARRPARRAPSRTRRRIPARLAAVVLPVEQMPDDELFALAAKKQLRGQPRRPGASACSRTRRRRRWSRTSPCSGCSSAGSRTSRPTRSCSRPSTTSCARRCSRRRAVLRGDHPRGPQHPRPDRRRLHLPQRAAGPALRHRRHQRQRAAARSRRSRAASRSAATSSSASTCRRRRARRPADAGQRADGHLQPDAHLAGEARPLGAGADPRHAAAAAAAGRAGAGRGRQGGR